MTQAQLAALTGISRATLQRLERDEIEHPSVRALANCAHVLGVALEDLIESSWRAWYVFDATNAPAPPMERFARRSDRR